MVNQQNLNQGEVVLKTTTENQGVLSSLQDKFNDFFVSLGNVLTDITALEVNTMVCREITGHKFMPWEIYRDMYPISEEYLAQQGIHSSLRPRYLSLRKSLELEFTLMMTDTKSEFYDPNVVASLGEDAPILTDSQVELAQIETKLLNPHNPNQCEKLHRLLGNSRFLSLLRKTSELKAALDNRNQTLNYLESQKGENLSPQVREKELQTDVIYAQTVIQLDGDIINRYSETIFDHPHRDLILQIHKTSVEAGHQEWRGLFGFVVNMVRNAIGKGLNSAILPFSRNESNNSN